MTLHRPPAIDWSAGDCGPPDCSVPGGSWGDIQKCWNEIEQFRLFLADVMSRMGPIPMMGVTDGSIAAPGMIGEAVTGLNQNGVPMTIQPAGPSTSFTYTAATTITLSPGDWDVSAMAAFDAPGSASIPANPIANAVNGSASISTAPPPGVPDALWPIGWLSGDMLPGLPSTQFALSAERINVTTVTQVWLSGAMFEQTGTTTEVGKPGFFYGSLYARRMR